MFRRAWQQASKAISTSSAQRLVSLEKMGALAPSGTRSILKWRAQKLRAKKSLMLCPCTTRPICHCCPCTPRRRKANDKVTAFICTSLWHLLSCLEMWRDVKQQPLHCNPRQTHGLAPWLAKKNVISNDVASLLHAHPYLNLNGVPLFIHHLGVHSNVWNLWAGYVPKFWGSDMSSTFKLSNMWRKNGSLAIREQKC